MTWPPIITFTSTQVFEGNLKLGFGATVNVHEHANVRKNYTPLEVIRLYHHIPSLKSYAKYGLRYSGSIAKVAHTLIQSSIYPFEGIFSCSRSGLICK